MGTTSKDLAELLDGADWTLDRRRKHQVWRCPCGEHRVSFPSTPSDYRSMANTLADVRRMGCPSLEGVFPERKERRPDPEPPGRPAVAKVEVEWACVICGKEITRSTSYAIAPGRRACRKHEGVREHRIK